MKVVWEIIPSLYGGGAEKMIIDLSRSINHEKYKVILISLYNERKADKFRLEDANNANVNLVFLDKRKGLDLRVIFQLVSLLKKERPDVIHTHLKCLKYVWPIAFAYKIKHIHTRHSDFIGREKMISKCATKMAYKSKNYNMVVLSESIKKKAENYYKIYADRIFVISNGIDIDRYRCTDRKEKDMNDSFTFICVARLNSIKNHKLLIEAFTEFQKNYNRNDKLVLLGDGPLRSEIENKIIEVNMQESIELVGNVKNVEEYLKRSDVFLLTSFSEGEPLSIIEAMSAGLPIIASNVGGIHDMIIDNGILFESNDKDALIDAMKHIVFDSDFRSLCSKQSIILSNKYSLKEMATEYEKLFS